MVVYLGKVLCIWVGWLNACSPDGCWRHQANKMSIVVQTWLISIASGFPWGTQEMVTPEGQCIIDFQIWRDTVFKSTQGECDLFPLKSLLKPLARNQDPILVPFLNIYHSLGILLIWLFIAFLSPVEVKLHADKDLVCLSCLPGLIFLVPRTVPGTLTGLSMLEKFAGARASKGEAEKRAEDGGRLSFSDFSQKKKKNRKENFLF